MSDSSSSGQTLAEIAHYLDASLCGDGDCRIFGLSTPENAGTGQICFIAGEKQAALLSTTQASAVILAKELQQQCPCHALVVANPKDAMMRLARWMYPAKPTKPGIHHSVVFDPASCQIDKTVAIGPNVTLGEGVCIGERCVIGPGVYIGDGVKIAANSMIRANVVLYQGVCIGQRTEIHAGAVIGADGFGFVQNEKGHSVKVPQIGTVIIGDDVEIGANTSIDRGTIDNTVIGNGVKLDNQVMVGHNVIIGDHTVIAGCTGIAGSAKIGRFCQIGGACAINGHITIGDHVYITGMAMVTKSLLKPGIYGSGTGILPYRQWQKSAVRFKQLDEMQQRLVKLEREKT